MDIEIRITVNKEEYDIQSSAEYLAELLDEMKDHGEILDYEVVA